MLSIPHISRNHTFMPVHINNSPDSPPQDLSRFPRRMSDSVAPALYAAAPAPDQHSHCRYNNHLTSTAFAYNPSPPPLPLYSAHLHRGASTGSLRDLRHHHAEFSPHPQWKQHIDPRHSFFDNRPDAYDDPISPLQPNFSGGLSASPNSGIPYSPISENPYGPSPPGTGTSTSSSVAPLANGPCMPCSPTLSITQHLQRSLSTPNMAAEAADTRTYAFVALPGNAVKKRPRRRYDEIERLYQCSWPECSKAYGTLNHLNAHVTMQKHGPKRTPDGKCPDCSINAPLYMSMSLQSSRKCASNGGKPRKSKVMVPEGLYNGRALATPTTIQRIIIITILATIHPIRCTRFLGPRCSRMNLVFRPR
jgi:hypothetical protein